MKENFNKSLEEVLKHEGGFVNHPEDPGGMTNMGITAKVYAEFFGKRLLTITEKDMRNLTVEAITPIYKRKYWDQCRCDQLPSGLDFAVFDYAVNSGPSRAVKHLQECLSLEADGLVGTLTLKHAKDRNTQELIKEYIQRRQDFLEELKTFKTFGKGWIRRIEKTKEVALSLIQEPITSRIDDETRAKALEWLKTQA